MLYNSALMYHLNLASVAFWYPLISLGRVMLVPKGVVVSNIRLQLFVNKLAKGVIISNNCLIQIQPKIDLYT